MEFLEFMPYFAQFPSKVPKRKNDNFAIILNQKKMEEWSNNILKFYEIAEKEEVKMLMVDGGAVNYHGYKRHSADVDFWIDTSSNNLKKLISVFKSMGYDIDSFPKEVIEKKQNISVKFSPVEPLNLELITNFSVNKPFEDVYNNADVSLIEKNGKEIKVKILNFDDLITSKIKANRPKDLLDIQELRRVKPDYS